MRLFWMKVLRFVIFLSAGCSFLSLSGCTSTQSILEPAAAAAREVTTLFMFVFYIAAAIFIMVEGLLIYFVIRFQQRAGQGNPEQIHGSTPLEVAWTVAPALILLVVFVFTIRTMADTAPTVAPGKGIPVRVIGHQWWWEFQYPDDKVVTATELHVPVGQLVTIELASKDVIHSFWVPQLMGKTDVVPGHTNGSWIRAETAGMYNGQCAEFCGDQHAHMLFRVVAQTPDEFQSWIKDQQAAPEAPQGESAAGQQAFLKASNGCIGCHMIDGTTAKGVIGPNLTHFASRKSFAGAFLENTAENLRKWLNDPQAIKPGNDMKIPKLSDGDIQLLITYLEGLK